MKAPRFSARTRWDPAPNRLARLRAEFIRDGVPIIDLTESNPTRCGFDYPGEEILAALAHPGALYYAPDPRGHRPAREAVARSHGPGGDPIDPDRIILCSGTSEAYGWLMKLLCDPADEILVPAPSYPLFDFIAAAEGVRLLRYQLEYESSWRLDLRALERAHGPKTRAVIIVQPNNPTGSFLSPEELAGLGEICAARGTALISDEVFAPYTFRDGAAGPPGFPHPAAPLTFTLGGLSKAAGLPQLKLSWIVAGGSDEEGIDDAMARLEILGDTFLSVNTPVQVAAERILSLGEGVQRQIRRRIRDNRRLLEERAGGGSWDCLDADGGWYGILRIPRVMDDEDLALEILRRRRVGVYPGRYFDFPRDGHLVVSLLPEEEAFAEGIFSVSEFINGL